ncbi:MAG: hypothetical protein LC749_19450, partial [Actinobacteria bacterium]|nr:hypothetical protein [Actinomycetota bacterium]
MADTRKTSPRRRYKKAKKSHLGLWILLGLVGLVGLYAFALEYSRPHVTGDNLKLSEFTDLVGKGKVTSSTLLDADAYSIGTYTRADGSSAEYNTPYLKEGLGDITKLLLSNRVETTV